MKIMIHALRNLAIPGFLFILLFTGCQPDLEDPRDGGNPPSGETVTAGIRGIVIDENNQPVMNATVTSGTNTATTDRYGVFRFNNISLLKANGYVKVSKPGYFTGIRSFPATAGRIHNVRIKLLPKAVSGSFTAATGGTITISGGAKLVVPAVAISDASGSPYAGMVNVAMTWINPTATDLSEIIPGDLRGLTTSGEERGLETFGMLGVELTGSGGQSLKIAAGKTAELTFPIPAALAGTAPATIDLWYFDETSARWKQEGQATKTGTNYVGNVSHFSFWNCDAPFPVISLCMRLVNASNSAPLNNVLVRIRRSNNSYGSGYTDSLGNLCGLVPKDEPLVLQVMDHCYNVAYSQNIGPFSTATDLGTISVSIPAVNTLIITGTVTNCAGANVTHGAAVIYTGGGHSYSVPITAGTFSLTLITCGSTALSFSLIGVDYATLQQSNPVSGSGTTGTINVGAVQACGTSAAQWVELLIDGIPHVYADPPDNIMAFDSTASPPFSNNTTIMASGSSGSTSYTSFTFHSNGVPATNLPITFCYISTGTLFSSVITTVNPVTTVTVFGPPGTGFIEGSFNIQMDFGPAIRNVVCNYRVRRP